MSSFSSPSRFAPGVLLERSAPAKLAGLSHSNAVQFGRYLVVGVVALAADAALLFGLTQYARLHYLLSAAIAYVGGLAVNYALSLAWVFKQRVYSNRAVEFALFASIGVVGLGLNEAVMWFIKGRLGFHYMAAKGVSAALVVFWNFGARKALLFSAAAPAGSTSRTFEVSEQPAATAFRRRLEVAVPVAAIAYFTLAASAIAYARLPFVDEGVFIGSSVNILRTGLTGNPSVPPWGLGIPLPDSQVHNFWVLPGYLYAQAAWFKIFPVSVHSARGLSILSGIAALALMYRFLRLAAASRTAAVLSLILISADFNMIMRAATARMDTLSLAINFASWVAYLNLRRRSLTLAVAVSCALAASGLLVHPNGIFAFAGLAILAIGLDFRRLGRRSALAAAVCSFAPLTLLAPLYLRGPGIWAAQMRSHTRGRFLQILTPLTAIRDELYNRYLSQFGCPTPFVLAPNLLLLIVLIAYAAGVIAAILHFRRAQPLYRFALGMFAVTAGYFTFFEAGHFFPYTVHLLPWFCILLAGALIQAVNAGRRRLAIAAAAVVLSINLAATVAYFHDDRYHKNYLPVLERVTAEMGTGDLLLGHSYFGIPLGFNRVSEDYTLVDVLRRHPKFVTLNQHFRLEGPVKTWTNGVDPEAWGMIAPGERTAATAYLLSHYAVVLQNRDYRLYRRVSE